MSKRISFLKKTKRHQKISEKNNFDKNAIIQIIHQFFSLKFIASIVFQSTYQSKTIIKLFGCEWIIHFISEKL